MSTEKLFISNRSNQSLSVAVEKNEFAKGLVFVMHGLGGFKEQEQIKAFLDSGFTVVSFDAKS